MKKLLILLAACTMLCACERPDYGSITNHDPIELGGGGSTKALSANYTYVIKQPLTIVITDKCEGYTKVEYDFGNGKKTTIYQSGTISYRYATSGTYNVTARAFDSNGKYKECSKSITISKPRVFIKGIQYTKISYQNRYYKADCYDDDFFSHRWFYTNYTPMLTNNILPYTYTFNTPVEMTGLDSDDYYTIRIFQNTAASGDGTQILKQQLLTIKLLQYQDYYELTNDPGTQTIRVLMEYK